MYLIFFSEEFETVMHTHDTIAPVGYINFKKFCLLKKPVGKILIYVMNWYFYYNT